MPERDDEASADDSAASAASSSAAADADAAAVQTAALGGFGKRADGLPDDWIGDPPPPDPQKDATDDSLSTDPEAWATIGEKLTGPKDYIFETRIRASEILRDAGNEYFKRGEFAEVRGAHARSRGGSRSRAAVVGFERRAASRRPFEGAADGCAVPLDSARRRRAPTAPRAASCDGCVPSGRAGDRGGGGRRRPAALPLRFLRAGGQVLRALSLARRL